MSISPRPEVLDIQPVAHGAISDAEIIASGGGPVIDFSVNSNPLGPSPRVAAALADVDVSRYPDPHAQALHQALSIRLTAPMERIVVGNGSAELIWLIALAYLRAADQALIVGPTFGEYRRVCQIMSAMASDILAIAETNFQPPVNDIIAAVETLHPRVVFLCNPNNPTGVYLPRKDIERIVAAGRDTLWAIDEAYLPFVNKPDSLLHLADERNIILLRSMTKDSALAGLRLGYSVSHPSIAANIERVRPPWSVNAVAQAAGLASLGDEGHLKKSQEIVAGSRAYLTAELKALGFVVYPSSANFILSEVPRFSGLDTAAHWRARLLVHGVCVRDCASFGLPRHIRLGIRTIPECQRLIEAIAGVIADG